MSPLCAAFWQAAHGSPPAGAVAGGTATGGCVGKVGVLPGTVVGTCGVVPAGFVGVLGEVAGVEVDFGAGWLVLLAGLVVDGWAGSGSSRVGLEGGGVSGTTVVGSAALPVAVTLVGCSATGCRATGGESEPPPRLDNAAATSAIPSTPAAPPRP